MEFTLRKVGRPFHSSVSLSRMALFWKQPPFSEQPQFIEASPKMVASSGIPYMTVMLSLNVEGWSSQLFFPNVSSGAQDLLKGGGGG